MTTAATKTLRVAAIQMISGNDLTSNLAAAKALIHSAAQSAAQLVVLPETFSLFRASGQLELAQQEASDKAQVLPLLKSLAKHYQLWIVAGSIPVLSDDGSRVYSACIVLDDQGAERARYHKIHLFDADVADQQGSYRESDTFAAGDRVVIADTPWGRLGLAICYDIRFPELFRAMLDQGVDMIAVPAAFTLTTGEAHWLPLLRARAIENQCAVIGANQGGQHSSKRSSSGGSVIIDSWGTVLAEAGRGETVVCADLDLATQQTQRTSMPAAQHRRFSYPSLGET